MGYRIKRHARGDRQTRRRLFLESLEDRRLLNASSLVDDTFEVGQNLEIQSLPVLANDLFDGDYGGERRITSVSYGSQGGRIQIADGGAAVEYAPPADFAGAETFMYFVDDALSAKVTVNVRSPVDHDFFTARPDGRPIVLDVQDNDLFWANYEGPRRISSLSESILGGEVSISSDQRSITYTPPRYTQGQDGFVYITDEAFPAQVKIDLISPLANDTYYEIIQNSVDNELSVLGNDPFWPGYEGAGQITHVTEPTRGGTATLTQDGQAVLYTPDTDFNGWDDFKYVIDGTFEATVRLQVHRPVRDDNTELDRGSTNFLVMLTDNDTFSYYRDGHRITRDVIDRATWVGDSDQGGTVVLLEDGQAVLYSAPPDFEGEDTFEYLADDKHRAKVTLRITSPVRDDYLYDIYQDTVDNVLDVLTNDFKGNGYDGPRLITSVTQSDQGGTVQVATNGRSLHYSPPAGFLGMDTFSYTVDGQLQADVRVSVSSLVRNDYHTFCPNTANGGAYVLRVLDNDHFGGNYPGAGVITDVIAGEQGGEITIGADGRTIRFAPEDGGYADFTYVVDGKYEATVSVNFRTYLRSDSFVVDQNSLESVLSPLENDFQDQYGAARYCGPYQGLREITALGTTEQGGEVTILGDLTILYTPAPDFVGDDRFTYTVDRSMRESISVHVIRRVRDDAFRVDVNSLNNELTVLVNDLFGADYSGAGRVTGVTDATEGGTVTIGQDGRSIFYAPPLDFVGQDAFTYTVDGALKARGIITVAESAADTLPRFDSPDQFQEFLIDDALQRYDGLFGQKTHQYRYVDTYNWGTAVLDNSMLGAEAALRSHSETNVQVAGVDEGDIIETDGDSLYILTEGELVIADAWPADELSVISRTAIKGEAIAEYLHGDRLTVISRTQSDDWPMPLPDTDDSLITHWFPYPSYGNTWVTVFDVSLPKTPEVVQQTELDGQYVDSRRIDDFVFFAMRHDKICLPEPARIRVEDAIESDGFWMHAGDYVYESREAYLARVRQEMGSLLESILPKFTSYGPDGEVARTGLLNAPDDLFRPLDEEDVRLVSVVSLNMNNQEPGISDSAGIFTSGADKIYGSLDNLYVFDDKRTSEDGNVTRILKFDWDAESGGVTFVAKGGVVGRMLNQFSADEFDGSLRIATTIGNSYSGNYSGRSENVLFVLRDDAGILEFAGGLQNLALDETIRSVRFMGERAFITTFRDIDPLFALDLQDPNRPVSVGHITMPGFNSYMQLIDENHILSVGRNTPVGFTGPTQVSLFDVEDLRHPRLLDQYTFERFSTSEAEADHHAFGWFAEHQVLAVPSARDFWNRVDQDGDGYHETKERVREDALVLFRIDPTVTEPRQGGIVLHGETVHDSPVRRSAYIEHVLYSVADHSTIAVNIDVPTEQFAETRYDDPDEPTTPGGKDPATDEGEETTKLIQLAKDHLAAAKGLQGGEILAITTETAHWKSAALAVDAEPGDPEAIPGFRIVLGINNDRFLYHSDALDTVSLVQEAFQFGEPSVVWHNAELPEDVNRDGFVTPVDALVSINEMNRHGSYLLRAEQVIRMIHTTSPFCYDVDGDGHIAPIDVLRVVNRLNGNGPADEGIAEGEGISRWAASVAPLSIGASPANDEAPIDDLLTVVTPRAYDESTIDVLARDTAGRSDIPEAASSVSELFEQFGWLTGKAL